MIFYSNYATNIELLTIPGLMNIGKIGAVKLSNLEGFLVPLDTVTLEIIRVLFWSLKKYGFGQNFIFWIRRILKNEESGVIFGGNSTFWA